MSSAKFLGLNVLANRQDSYRDGLIDWLVVPISKRDCIMTKRPHVCFLCYSARNRAAHNTTGCALNLSARNWTFMEKWYFSRIKWSHIMQQQTRGNDVIVDMRCLCVAMKR